MISWVLLILSLIGLVLSWYAYHVEQYAGKKKGYHPLCDINDTISCSKAFTSVYGKTAGVSNGTWGMLFYIGLAVLSVLGEVQWLFLASCFAVIASLYLAYTLYVKVKTMCVVCTAVYLINVAIALIAYFLGF